MLIITNEFVLKKKIYIQRDRERMESPLVISQREHVPLTATHLTLKAVFHNPDL